MQKEFLNIWDTYHLKEKYPEKEIQATIETLIEEEKEYSKDLITEDDFYEEFFDYEAKYNATKTNEICPTPIDEQQTKAVSRLAEAAHRALMLSGFSRSDFMLTASGELMTIETNTIPGLTDVSIFPKAAAVAGLSFPELVDGLVRQAIRIKRRK